MSKIKSKSKNNNKNDVQVLNQQQQVNPNLKGINLNLVEVQSLISTQKKLLDYIHQQKQNKITQDDQKIQNLSTVLLQSLHTKDQQLIYYTLQKNDQTLISNTVKNLITSKVTILLEYINEAILKKPYNSHIYLKWLKYLLRYHATILLNKSNLGLVQNIRITLQNRTRNIDQLIKFKGKLEMVLVNYDGEKQITKKKPNVIYVQTKNNEIIEEQ